MNAATHIPRRLLRYTDDETSQQRDDRELLEAAEKRLRESQSPFQIGFGRILNSAEMTACERLRDSIMALEIGGNACQSYEGDAVDTFNYGGKTITERVEKSGKYINRCKLAVVCCVQMEHHDAWRVFTSAIAMEKNVIETGDMINQMRKDKMGEHKRRELAANIVQKSAASIIDITY